MAKKENNHVEAPQKQEPTENSASEKEAADKADAEKANAEKAASENAEEEKFINPFSAGVTYEEFEKALGEKTVREYLTGKTLLKADETPEQVEECITWIETEIKNYKQK